MSSSQILPPSEGPEYTPCGCSHIESEHEPDAGACLSCDCEAYRPAAAPAPVSSAPADRCPHGCDVSTCPCLACEADQAELRDRIAEALLDHLSRTADIRPGRNGQLAFMPEIDDPERMRITDAVLPVLPAPADRAAVLREAADRLEARAAEFTAAARKDPLAFVKGATDARYRTADCWDAAAAELRRMADEAQQPETQADACAHCGKTILRITGTLTAWWVHDPGGHTMCDPQRAASSPRATPEPVVEAQQPEARS